MKSISIKLHGVLDYSWSLLLIVFPYITPLESRTAATILVATGFLTILYSLFTAYEFGPVKLIPFKVHAALDALIGLFLVSSPWVFEFKEASYIPHLVFGIVEVVVVIMTVKQPAVEINQ